MRRMYSLLLAACTSLLAVAPAQDTLRTTQVAVFKNGTGFFIREGTIRAPNGTWRLREVPEALFGTLWADAPGNSIPQMAAYTDTIRLQKPVNGWSQALHENIGKNIRLWLASDEEPVSVEGTLLQAEGELAVVRTANGTTTATSLGQIQRVDYLTNPTLTAPQDSLAWTVLFGLKTASNSQALRLYYLRRQVGWLPSYRVELLAGNKARLQLRANFMNDAENLQEATVRFTVGVPNFKYTNVREPLTLRMGLEQVLNALNGGGITRGGGGYNVMANAMLSQTTVTTADAEGDYGGMDEGYLAPVSVGESQAQDLYFYEVRNVTLPQGGRGNYTLLEQEVPYEDVYEVNLPANGGYFQPRTPGEDEPTLPVWHSVRLHNTGTSPWTTGSALVVDRIGASTSPIAQDQMNYTPGGDKRLLRLTTAPDVSVIQSEEEVTREQNLKLRNNQYYDLVTVKATIRIKNFKDKTIKLTLERLLTGEPLTTSTDWQKVALPMPYGYVPNRQHRLTWEPSLNGGQELEITYTYKLYVPR